MTATRADLIENVSPVSTESGNDIKSPDTVIAESAANQSDVAWTPSQPQTSKQVKLTILQITDVYTLENLASFKTLVDTARKTSTTPDCKNSKVICMLTGDFLAPYLLSSLDRGAGMMKALNSIPLDYLSWGNHEADIDHKTVCKHVRNFKGTWLNSNMRDHEAMDSQKDFDVIELTSADGTHTRRVGLVSVLSNDPDLYEEDSFGGATVDDPWETLKHYKSMLEGKSHNCDVVVPLQHLYTPDDHKTCREFDFPVILSGHDHHRVDEVVEGTRLLKPGMDAIYATALELVWDDATEPGNKPTISARFVKCSDYPPDLELKEQNERAYDVLLPLRNTELARIPPTFEPLSSKNARSSLCTMGQYICTILKSSLNRLRKHPRPHVVDAVMLMGGNIRAGADYPEGSFFSMEALESEIQADEVVGIVPMPGWLISEGIQVTHAGDPIPGWFQYDTGIQQDPVTKEVTHVNGQPLEPDRIYRVATKVSDLTNGQSPPLKQYFEENPKLLHPEGHFINIQFELMGFFAQNLWRKIWENTTEHTWIPPFIRDTPVADILAKAAGPFWTLENEEALQLRMRKLDLDDDGVISIEEIHAALRDLIGISVDDRNMIVAEYVQAFADRTGDGRVTMEDLELYSKELPAIYERNWWRLAFAKTAHDTRNTVNSTAA